MLVEVDDAELATSSLVVFAASVNIVISDTVEASSLSSPSSPSSPSQISTTFSSPPRKGDDAMLDDVLDIVGSV
eukprot:CAMPEP_0117054596 /NCGR_PEP_ID=MMETSP0472-20121206/37839_1 /TAXON_ID=693140 ORGANISM="Tiarina fusus, Strain LIS" /NCGR_SAMPLE_ID=MMETSP0472 /ASSEMBLY_ACC=CAM_ASM_000603 /LENGTH=73 /DNA_ID=CAMNT_0004770249 /DNA_START=230 /DNA_END=451 /DNA_ORIENTATION=+